VTALELHTERPTEWSSPARSGQLSALVDLDPDLGRDLPPHRWDAARRELPVRVGNVERGPWSPERVGTAGAAHLGILIVDGLVARELLAHDVASMELLGPGDVLRPWGESAESELLEAVVRWSALAPTRFALLDRQLAARLAAYPELHCALLERFACRTRRLAVLQAISQLNRVDRRLLTLLWHLAERWGRMTPDGVALPMTLSHRMLGQLIGARRPTVSTALGHLAKEREVVRRDDGTWLLTGAPVGVPAPDLERIVPMRRRLLPANVTVRPAATPTPIKQLAPQPATALEPVHVRGVELRAVLERLREQAATHVEQIRVAFATSTELAEHANALRERCRETRAIPRRNGVEDHL
jgi:CRP/FNR family cyclic AMP-dependent transcriptional regulator